MGDREIGLVQAFDGSAKFGAAYARDFARAAEAAGFHSVWVPEHIVFFQRYESVYPYPPEPGSASSPQLPVGRRPALFDPLLTCQALALHTTTLRVGTAVALVPLRHPLLWAREVATLDHFSAGRFELGVGVGWLAEEYDALGVSFADRGRIADEHLGALRTVWATDDSSYHGRHVDFTDAVSLPNPLQAPGPPILVGGESEAALRRVARYGDGWFGWNMTPSQLAQGLDRLDVHLGREAFTDGRRRTRADLTIQVGLRCLGGLDELAGLVDAYTAAGATRVAASVPIRPAELDARLAAIAGALGVGPRG
jgi:probable F420-dependent oxidoreductase